tara:strand:+ start:3033 stop:3290 length:258 start_codon:yes stop_codon:yes gene_type:complete
MSQCSLAIIPSRDLLGQDMFLNRDRQFYKLQPSCRSDVTSKHTGLACPASSQTRLDISMERVHGHDACTAEAAKVSTTGIKVPYL